MKRTPTKFNYLVQHITSAITRGEYTRKDFPSERALAEDIGMSVATVRKAVMHCIENGYLIRNETSRQPEVHPRHLKKGNAKNIAVILPSFPALAHSIWYSAIESVCAENNFPITMITYHDPEDPNLIKHLNSSYDRIFVLPPPRPSPFLISQMKRNAERLVTLFHDYSREGIITICDPPSGLTQLLLKHLMDKNCRVIHLVNAVRMPNAMIEEEIKSWRDFISKNKCSGQLITSDTEISTPGHVISRTLIRSFLQKNRLPDAFLCTTSQTAVGVLRGLADCSLRAGPDVLVAAISPSETIQHTTPSITGMKPIIREKLIKIALQNNPPLHIEYPEIELFIGESTELDPALRNEPFERPLPSE